MQIIYVLQDNLTKVHLPNWHVYLPRADRQWDATIKKAHLGGPNKIGDISAIGRIFFKFFIQNCIEIIPNDNDLYGLVQGMAGHQAGSKPLPDPVMTHFTNVCTIKPLV